MTTAFREESGQNASMRTVCYRTSGAVGKKGSFITKKIISEEGPLKLKLADSSWAGALETRTKVKVPSRAEDGSGEASLDEASTAGGWEAAQVQPLGQKSPTSSYTFLVNCLLCWSP